MVDSNLIQEKTVITGIKTRNDFELAQLILFSLGYEWRDTAKKVSRSNSITYENQTLLVIIRDKKFVYGHSLDLNNAKNTINIEELKKL